MQVCANQGNQVESMPCTCISKHLKNSLLLISTPAIFCMTRLSWRPRALPIQWKHPTETQEIPRGTPNGSEILVTNFRKIIFQKFWKKMFHSSLEISKKIIQIFRRMESASSEDYTMRSLFLPGFSTPHKYINLFST